MPAAHGMAETGEETDMAKRSRKSEQTGKLKEELQAIQSAGERLSLKWEAARNLQLLTKVEQVGWGGLSSKETGAIGAWVSRMKRATVMQGQTTGTSKDGTHVLGPDHHETFP